MMHPVPERTMCERSYYAPARPVAGKFSFPQVLLTCILSAIAGAPAGCEQPVASQSEAAVQAPVEIEIRVEDPCGPGAGSPEDMIVRIVAGGVCEGFWSALPIEQKELSRRLEICAKGKKAGEPVTVRAYLGDPEVENVETLRHIAEGLAHIRAAAHVARIPRSRLLIRVYSSSLRDIEEDPEQWEATARRLDGHFAEPK